MGKFPIKVMYSTGMKVVNPSENVLSELDRTLNNNPFSDMSVFKKGGYLPDLTRAIKLENAIYRVNVPGYFYHRVKDVKVAGSGRDELIIAAYPSLIDTVVNLTGRQHNCDASGEYQLKWKAFTSYNGPLHMKDGKSGTCNVTLRDAETNVIGEQLNTTIGTHQNPRSPSVGYATRGAFGVYFSNRRPIYDADGVMVYDNIKSTVKSNPDIFVANGHGSSANNLIPIVPGSGALRQFAGRNVAIDANQTNNGSSTTVNGFFEARGTYIYHTHWNNTVNGKHVADDDFGEYLFIPCRCVANTVRPLTKIRDVSTLLYGCIGNAQTVYSNIATLIYGNSHKLNYNSAWIGFLDDVEPNGINSYWYLLDKFTADASNPNGGKPKIAYKNWLAGQYVTVKMAAHAMCFYNAFSNASIRPLTDPFIAQRFYKFPDFHASRDEMIKAGVTVPSEKCTVAVYQPHTTTFFRDLTLFDPTKDGEFAGQEVEAKHR